MGVLTFLAGDPAGGLLRRGRPGDPAEEKRREPETHLPDAGGVLHDRGGLSLGSVARLGRRRQLPELVLRLDGRLPCRAGADNRSGDAEEMPAAWRRGGPFKAELA